MSAPEGNKNASKNTNDLGILITAYITHRAAGFSKESFIDGDYRTIEKHLENDIVLQSLKKELKKAERIGLKYWEQLGMDITNGKVKGNPATWIFTMKNKYPASWKDKSEIDHNLTPDSDILKKAIERAEQILNEKN